VRRDGRGQSRDSRTRNNVARDAAVKKVSSGGDEFAAATVALDIARGGVHRLHALVRLLVGITNGGVGVGCGLELRPQFVVQRPGEAREGGESLRDRSLSDLNERSGREERHSGERK
jgi:hypothetical protein